LEEVRMTELQTNTQNITERRLVNTESKAPLNEGEVRLKIDRFAFTANNVTYGAVGEQIGYWQFFPPTTSADDTTPWGMIPVWGYASVIESRHPEIAIGERVYGYLPMATEWVMQPGRVNKNRWVDAAPHRAQLPAVYNSYQRFVDTPEDSQRENFTSLLMPLYGTAFCLCDALEAENYHGAEQVLIVSASSKTSLGLAYGLSQLPEGERPDVVGLTSAGNQEFVASVGLYDQVVTYDGLDAIDTDKPAVIVDMSGNRKVLGTLHQALGDNMRWCHNVGLTHWDDPADAKDPSLPPLNRERSAMFFAPGHIAKRTEEWGADEWNRRMGKFTQDALGHAATWLAVREIAGLEAFLSTYDDVVGGKINAREGLMVVP
jgi:hypothetical protein